MPHIAYQLYCSRNFPPIGDVLEMLQAAGYKHVEGYGGLFGEMDALRAGLDATGLTMTSCHMGLDAVEDDAAGSLVIAKALGLKGVYVPFVQPDDRPTTSAGWVAFGKRLGEAGKPFLDAGLNFGWHNHAFEFDATESGDLPLDLIMSSTDALQLELDLGWVRVAGHDPVEWINKYADRITAAHIKDIAPDGTCTDEDGWADVGHGIMDWAAIHAALKVANVQNYVIEHDNPSDHARFAQRSLAAVSKF